MNRTLQSAIFVLMLLATGMYVSSRLSKSNQSAPEPEKLAETKAIAEAPVQKTNFQTFQAKPVQVHALANPDSSKIDPRLTDVPKDQIVDFKVINGLAVAYGDTVLGKPAPGFSESKGLAEIQTTRVWKSNEIPYVVDAAIKNKVGIQEAIDLFNSHTNLKFVAQTQQEDFIVFTPGKENCMSALGRVGGAQPIYLEERCGKIEIAHELMHALGFPHEQSRTDRDRYVTILWDNISPEFRTQFEMVPENLMQVYGDTPFDPNSVLMYGPHIFAAKPDLETMKLKDGNPIEETPQGLSQMDVARINRLYSN